MTEGLRVVAACQRDCGEVLVDFRGVRRPLLRLVQATLGIGESSRGEVVLAFQKEDPRIFASGCSGGAAVCQDFVRGGAHIGKAGQREMRVGARLYPEHLLVRRLRFGKATQVQQGLGPER